jgi:hypothetical protein
MLEVEAALEALEEYAQLHPIKKKKSAYWAG